MRCSYKVQSHATSTDDDEHIDYTAIPVPYTCAISAVTFDDHILVHTWQFFYGKTNG